MKTLDEYLKANNATRLAEQLGVTKGYISQLRHGNASVSLRMAFRIEDATGGAVLASSFIDRAVAE